MRKVLSLILAIVFVLSLAACSEKAPADNTAKDAKLGLGVYVETITPIDAEDAETNGKSGLEATFAALLIAEDGKIIACKLDSTSNEALYTVDGTAVKAEYKTKRELGDNYNMVAWGGAKYEWNQQAASFAQYVTGKTAAEVAGIAVNEKTAPTDADLSTSVTIAIGNFQALIDKALQ